MVKKKLAGSQPSDKRFLCEGWLDEGCEAGEGLIFQPTRGVCIQGSKAWVAFGDTTLDESFGDVQLVENFDDLELEERQLDGTTVKVPKNGRWIVEGPAQRSGVRNANKRVYSKAIWEKLIGDKDSYVQQAIRERRMVGHLEHPKDGRTDLGEAAFLTIKAELREDGVVWNSFELLDTPKGMILQELTRKGVKWGVSSRGTGTVKDDGNVSEHDYHLKCWDAVAAPSTPGSFPTLSANEGENENTSGDTSQAELSEADEETLRRLVELSETDADDLSSRVALRDDILTTLLSLDENALQALLLRDEGWAKVARAIERVRDVVPGDAVDTAIEEALASGEEPDETESDFSEIIESLQEQVSTSIDEVGSLQERLEVAESETLEVTERLTEAEGELAQLRAERDLAHELLGTPGRAAGEVAALVSEAVDEEPALERFRDVLEGAESIEQVRNFVERFTEVLRPVETRVAETSEQPARTALPTGIGLDTTDYVPPRRSKSQIPESSGAALVAAMPGFRKNS